LKKRQTPLKGRVKNMYPCRSYLITVNRPLQREGDEIFPSRYQDLHKRGTNGEKDGTFRKEETWRGQDGTVAR